MRQDRPHSMSEHDRTKRDRLRSSARNSPSLVRTLFK